MASEAIRKTHIEFMYPGILFSESTTQEITDRGIHAAANILLEGLRIYTERRNPMPEVRIIEGLDK